MLSPLLMVFMVSGCEPMTGTGRGMDSPVAEQAVLPSPDYLNKKAVGWNLDGIDHLKREHWRKAAADFGRALAIDAKFAQAHFNRALALKQQGNDVEAREHFLLALKYGADDPSIALSNTLPEDLKKSIP